MQASKTTVTVAIISTTTMMMMALLLLVALPNTAPTAVFAQDSEDSEGEEDTLVGEVFAESESNNNTTGNPLGYQDVERAEVIDNAGNVQNPGGAGNENINLADSDSMTRPTNLADTVLPQTTTLQEYEDFEIALQAAGYSISDMQYTLAHRTDVPMVIVRGLEGVPTQPNLMILEQISASYGYALVSHVFIGGAWETTFESVTGN